MIIRQGAAFNDIKSIEANNHGKDYVIGDLHGNEKVLEAILAKLKPDDRLFSVGDLTDRGKDSVGVMKLILKTYKNNPNKIHVCRGNHENLTIECIHALEKMAARIAAFSPDGVKNFIKDLKKSVLEAKGKYGKEVVDISWHVKNGGSWIITLFREELQENKITINTKDEVNYQSDSLIKAIYDYMTSLPYIIHVRGNDEHLPFNIVHADMPFDDKELEVRLEKNEKLTIKEIKYATLARHDGTTLMSDKGRSALSIITFVGHNIISDGGIPFIRCQTNTLNLDVQTYNNNVSALYCASDHHCEYIGSGEKTARKKVIFQNIELEFNKKSIEQQMLNLMRMELIACKSTTSIKAVLQKTAEQFSLEATLDKKYLHTYDALLKFAVHLKAFDTEKFNMTKNRNHTNFFSKKYMGNNINITNTEPDNKFIL